MPSLLEIAQRTGTDKTGHGYIQEYQKWLPPTCRKLLEIGCERGRSALMWSEYFGHDELDLHLIDLFINKEFVSERWCRNKGFVPHTGDQSDTTFLYTIRDAFEIVVDDGSHRADHQLISWKHLFLNNCRSGSVYVIEDLHCNLDSFYWGSVTHIHDTPLAMFREYLQTGKLENPLLNENEVEVFQKIIDKVILSESEQIAFIWRK